MDGNKSKLVKLNELFVTFCASWASINVDFNLPSGRLAGLMDRFTTFWSLVIFATNLIKFLAFQESSYTGRQKLIQWLVNGTAYTEQSEGEIFCSPLELRDVLTLNYLPCINNFGKLYYGLVSVCMGAPLSWRLYLNYYKPIVSPTSRGHKNLAKKRLVQFFIDGPRESSAGSGDKQVAGSGAMSRQCSEDGCGGIRLDLSPWKHSDLEPVGNSKRGSPLSVLHRKFDNFDNGVHQEHLTDFGAEFYENPIRANNDFFDDHSERRWRFLLAGVHYLTLFIVLTGIPILYFTITALYAVIQNFTLPEKLDPNYLGRSLKVYGICEQIFATIESAIFFAFTNTFVSLFHADLIYKAKPIVKELKEIQKLYQTMSQQQQFDDAQTPTAKPIDEFQYIQRLQLRIWAYFDHLEQLDSFVSKYSVVSIITFIIGLSFGQSYLRVGDPSLKMGTAAVLAANLLSFVYLYIISWDIEQRSTRFHSILLSIVARETDLTMKRNWQKTLFGFYESDVKRTFTLNYQYPLNLNSLFKIMFALITMSLIMNRLFHKHAWETSFGNKAS